MTLASGSRLGPYEILSPLGAGGMGEVYRAKDSKLHRDVAVKVLPESLAKDPDALARFEREAHAVAALNHPNILSIFDFGSHEGSTFAVMELLEGETLREVLSEGAPPLRRTTEWARQIAAGLAAAHGKSIVHRDLKPDNIFVTNDGRVKILDFGLAKPTAKDRATDQTHSPTVSAYTEPGTVMGTVGYMSPEQVKGREVDARSDIFAFGAVLYEMLTGRRAFQRETAAETMTAILREEPADPGATGKSIPPALDRIVRHCLEKKPEQRFQSASDIGFALEDLSGSSAVPAMPGSVAPSRRFLIAAAVLAGMLAGAALALWLRRSPEPEAIRLRALTFSSKDSDPSASPDGRLIAFTSWRDGTSRIWIKQLVGGGEAPLTSGSDRRPRFSPDGSSILFLRNAGTTQAVFRVGLVGGEPRRLVDDAVEADWSPDGKKIVFIRLHEGQLLAGTMLVYDTETGKESLIVDGKGQALFCPRWAPDGRSIVFARGDRNRNAPEWELMRVDTATRKVTPVPPGAKGNPTGGFAWSGDGREFFFVQSASSMGDVSGSESRVYRCDARTGKRTTMLWSDGLATINGTEGGVAYCDVLSPGRLLIAERRHRQNLRELSLGKTGTPAAPRLLTQGNSVDRQPTYSPDGKQILFSSNRNANLDLWLLDVATGSLRQFTDDSAQDWDPGFTPDGKQILWDNDRGGHLEVWIANSDGSGARQLTRDGMDAENPTMTANGKWVVYWSGNPGKVGVWKIHPDGTGAQQMLPGSAVSTDVSPDGRYVLYASQEQSNLRCVVRFLEIESGKVDPFTIVVPYTLAAPGVIYGRARWAPDGRSIYYIGQNAAGLSGVFQQDFAPGRDTSVTRRQVAGFSPEYVTESLGISPDGSKITISTGDEFATILLAEGVPGALPQVRKSP